MLGYVWPLVGPGKPCTCHIQWVLQRGQQGGFVLVVVTVAVCFGGLAVTLVSKDGRSHCCLCRVFLVGTGGAVVITVIVALVIVLLLFLLVLLLLLPLLLFCFRGC